MRSNDYKNTLRTAVAGIAILLLTVGLSFAQQQINLTAGPTSTTLPDGSTVPMWGYSCGPTVTTNTVPAASCAALNPAAGASWSPVVVTVPTGQALTINLTNNLSFQPPTPGGGSAPAPNNIPTSIVILGQVGGGLGSAATYLASPIHNPQSVTWPIANTGAVNNPPSQGPRVHSMAGEVSAVPAGTTLTTCPVPTSSAPANGCATLTWPSLKPGTYLLESGTHPSIQVPMGLIGVLVVTTAPTTGTTVPITETAAGTAYPGVSYDAEIPLEFSEIDPVQNKAVNAAVNTAGFNETMVWSGQPGGCGNQSSPTYQQCYPPAVNYTPLYYLINGVAFNKTNPTASQFPLSNYIASTPSTSTATGLVLVRLVNAGLRMHVPSIVGSLTGATATNPLAGVAGFSILAEDGNPAPGLPKVQSDIFMAAGKTFDVMINGPACVTSSCSTSTALAIFDRELSLSGNSSERDAGMVAYIGVNGSGIPVAAGNGPAIARADTYNSLVAGKPFTVSDVSKGVIANDTNVYGVQLLTAPTNGTVVLNDNGTFTYTPPPSGTATSDTFSYCANGTVNAGVCSSGIQARVTLGAATIENASGITCSIPGPPTYTARTATYLSVKPPGVLAFCKDAAGYPLSIQPGSAVATGFTLQMDYSNGGFNATVPAGGTTYSFTFTPQNSQGTAASSAQTVTLNFPAPSNLAVTVKDPQGNVLTDYRWIIEEDKTFYVNPSCTTSTTTAQAGCPTWSSTNGIPPTFGVNFHTSHMEQIAQGCVGTVACESGQTLLGVPTVCDIGNGACEPGTQQTAVDPKQAVLDPGPSTAPFPKRYYISVLPGDAANPFNTANAVGGHSMGGAPITWNGTSWNPVTVLVEPTPFPTGKLSVQVFEDDFPLNGEQDAGGGIDVIATNEPGLGGFEIVLWDDMGGSGDVTGQMTYDMFNQPLSNSLAGTIDPATGLDACPISPVVTANTTTGDGTQQGITGMIVTCPTYESDGKTFSPLAGQAVVANLMPGRFSVQAYPGADRIARGEEWLQTNTLDGQHPHDSFIRVGEPNYFQEYGPAGFHVSIGFANPTIINARHKGVCNGTDLNLTATNCTNTVTGRITAERMSRTPDERLYSSNSRDAFYWTQCFVSLGDPDGEDFMFTKCDANGNFTFTGVPAGSWKLAIFDQWNDQLMDGLSTPVNVGTGGNLTVNMGDVPVQQWQANVYTRTFIDDNKDGVYEGNELGIPFLNTTVRYRDGSLANNLLTDFTGTANFNETFPLFNWYVVETDSTRYKTTGIHTVYDAGGPPDGVSYCGSNGYPKCGPSGTPYTYLANTIDPYPLPSNLSLPGAVYCPTADCSTVAAAFNAGTAVSSSSTVSTGRIDPPWVVAEGWQGFSGQNNFIEFGKAPYAPGENGGIHGHVIYASTRPFDDPQLLVQTQWEPLVPHVTINLYQEGFAADGVTPTLTLVDTTQTSSWDDWAQGFRTDGYGNLLKDSSGNYIPNMNCPGQAPAPTSTTAGDLFFYTLYNQPNYLDLYDSFYNGGTVHPLAYNSQFKCYDAMHNWNQLQPAPYDGMYSFPSVTGINPSTGKPTGTNCTICIPNPDTTDAWRVGTPMLPAGKYVVEVVMPAGYELVKEEDKNILIGDNFIAPVTQEFGGLGNIFIMPDQASVAALYDESGSGYNANNAQNSTQSMGAGQQNQIVPGFIEPVWPCVGEARTVPDYISLFPQSAEVAPFAGATRHLCDRKEVTLGNQMGATAKFYIYTSTHIASKYTGVITDDFTSEFDPFAPVFGEKFSPPHMPVSVKDWAGNEISRVYSDQWGIYNGLTYSTWEVNPPNPTGYSPTMMVQCMNDKGPIVDTRAGSPTLGQMITDPLFNPLYSQFCYELPYMPGQTDYLDTPVVPTAAFVGAGYNNPDCSYPTLTPAIASVISQDIAGPWVSAAGHTITITALGNQTVTNYGYAGPQATTTPFNQKTVTRHYGFGGTAGTVTVGGVPLANVSWSDTTITGTVQSSATVNGSTVNVPPCAVQQQAQYGGSTAYCGQLVITASTGQQSIDTVNVTIGGKQPTVLGSTQTIQSAIDAAAPGDMIIVPPGTYKELLIMWKPVRLQGVGAASAIIDASTHPAGAAKLDPWRASVNCLFGLALNGQPSSGTNVFDPTGTYSCPTPSSPTASGIGPDKNTWNYFYGGPNFSTMIVDRVPMEGILGWDATVNGNLAEQLQEPSLMGAYEGAGITVVAKGVNIPAGATDVYGSGAEAAFPTGSTLLTGIVGPNGGALTGDLNPVCRTSFTNLSNPYPSNFMCNPSGVDGLTITDASQGGGGMFVHAWAHNLQVANNRIINNAGTLSGGISVGQGESPEAYLNGTAADSNPGSCFTPLPGQTSTPLFPANTQLPYCENINVNLHNNMITNNSSTGDELFSGTPAGAGGVSICTGADFYKFNYNWVCGNLSTGDAGGLGHLGLSWNGDIEHNSVLFNQATNPSIQANGGGVMIMGAAPDQTLAGGVECGSVTDNDCAPGLSDGTGPGLVINANLIQGNAADAGSGGGLRLQGVNGTDIARNPNPLSGLGFVSPSCATQFNALGLLTCQWYVVQVTNNIIDNNVAGWDGAGVSLEDALIANLVNNTISSNDTTASSGVLFNTLGAPLASSQSPAPICQQNGGTVSCPQPAGLVSMQNSVPMVQSFTTGPITCPAGHFQPGTNPSNGSCIQISYPVLYNDLFWQNRSFQIGVGPLGTGVQNQQAVVSLYNAAFNGGVGSLAGSQASTGACPSGSSYWDIGVRNDLGPGDHSSGFTLNPVWSVLDSNATGYNGNNLTSNPSVMTQYCNGSRVPPEAKCYSATGTQVPCGYQVPAGIADAVVPNPVFSLTPAATVDEGNNWINMSWGPLSVLNPVTSTSTSNTLLGNYALQQSSPAVDYIPCSNTTGGCLSSGEVLRAPTTDFFGKPRPDPATPNAIDIGAVEYQGTGTGTAAFIGVSPTSLTFVEEGGLTSPAQTLTLTTGAVQVTGISYTITSPFARSGGSCPTTLPFSLAANVSCTIGIVFQAPSTAGTVAGTVTFTATNAQVSGSPVSLSGTSFSVAPASLSFGNELVGTTSATKAVTVANASTATSSLSISNISFGGINANQFTRINTGATDCGTTYPKTLAPGQSCTIGVAFRPTSTGLKNNAALLLGPAAAPIGNVPLSGTGTTVSFSGPTPSLVTNTATAHSGTITVTNSAGGAITLAAAPSLTEVSGPTGSTFSITGGTCANSLQIAAGGSCTVIVNYNPNGSTSSASGRLSISDTFSGGTGTATQTFTFSAN